MKRRTINIVIWSVIGAGIIGLGIWAAQPAPVTPGVNVVQSDDQVAGSRTSSVVLVEYSDFQCPACGAYEPLVKQVRDHYGDKIALVYRQFPLTQIHQYAAIAAKASEAANMQGKFWDYHDLLFARQDSWTKALDVKATLKEYAKELGLDQAKFATDIDSSAVNSEVSRDISRGNQSRVPGTPTFFLNGKKIAPTTYDGFVSEIDAALKG